MCHICEQEFGVYEKTGEICKVTDHCNSVLVNIAVQHIINVISIAENHLFFQSYFTIFKVMILIFL